MNKKDIFTTFSDWAAKADVSAEGINEEGINAEGINEESVKNDSEKLRVYQILSDFDIALLEVITVGEYGAEKYALHNWKHVEKGYMRYSDAMMRHILCELSGEVYDSESKLFHAAHTAWNALARLQLLMGGERREIDK